MCFPLNCLKLFIIFCLVVFPNYSFAAPNILSNSGTVSNGNTVIIYGSGFDVKHTPQDYDYFDGYSSDWSCDAVDGSCPSIPNGEDFTWKRIVFGYCSGSTCSGDYNMMLIDGNPLYNIDKNNSQYSTSRAWNEWIEYYDGSSGSGGLPNGSMEYEFAPTDEIFYVYYVYYDPSWPLPYTPAQDKNVFYWTKGGGSGDGRITGAWEYRSSPVNMTRYHFYGIPHFDSLTCESCNGFGNPRSNDVPWERG